MKIPQGQKKQDSCFAVVKDSFLFNQNTARFWGIVINDTYVETVRFKKRLKKFFRKLNNKVYINNHVLGVCRLSLLHMINIYKIRIQFRVKGDFNFVCTAGNKKSKFRK